MYSQGKPSHRALLVSALIAATFVACTTQPTPTGLQSRSSAAPTPTLSVGARVEGELDQIALQQSDFAALQGEFAPFDVGPTANLDRLPSPQAGPDRFGRLGGWKARYRQPPEVTTGILTIDSRVDVFPDAAAATSDLAAYQARYESEAGQFGGEVSVPSIGDAAVLSSANAAVPAAISTARIAWRRGPFTAQIVISGLGQPDVEGAVQTLAKQVDARMTAALAAP